MLTHTETISRNAQVSLDLLQYTDIVVWIIFFIKYCYTRTKMKSGIKGFSWYNIQIWKK